MPYALLPNKIQDLFANHIHPANRPIGDSYNSTTWPSRPAKQRHSSAARCSLAPPRAPISLSAALCGPGAHHPEALPARGLRPPHRHPAGTNPPCAPAAPKTTLPSPSPHLLQTCRPRSPCGHPGEPQPDTRRKVALAPSVSAAPTTCD